MLYLYYMLDIPVYIWYNLAFINNNQTDKILYYRIKYRLL
jgi:hypothetical protein